MFIASEPTSEKRTTSINHVKYSVPDFYHGERNKLQAFITQTDLYIQGNAEMLVKLWKRVLFIGFYLKGLVLSWFDSIVQNYLTNNSSTKKIKTKELFTNYNEFKKEFKRQFGRIDVEQTTERKIQSLKQTSFATEYTVKF